MQFETNATPIDVESEIITEYIKKSKVKLTDGVLSYAIVEHIYSNGDMVRVLNIRFIRTSDQKVYVGSFDNNAITGIFKHTRLDCICNDLSYPRALIPLETHYIFILNVDAANKFRYMVLNSEVDPESVYVATIDRLTNQIETMELEHANEIAAVHDEYSGHVLLRDC